MNIKFSAVVKGKTKNTVSGFVTVEDRCKDLEYNVKCEILKKFCVPGDVIGTDNVSLIYFKAL